MEWEVVPLTRLHPGTSPGFINLVCVKVSAVLLHVGKQGFHPLLDRTLLWAHQEYVINKSSAPFGRETFFPITVYPLMADNQGIYVTLKMCCNPFHKRQIKQDCGEEKC